MSKYGRVIEDLKEIKNSEIYRVFSFYFDNPVLTKTSVQGVSSVYAAKVNSGLMLDNKYLIVIVNNDSSEVGTRRQLSEVQWVSLQTRTVRDELKVEKFSYNPKKHSPFSDKIVLVGRNESSSTYRHDNLKELIITLLNSEKMQYEYPQNGTLLAALETFKTVLVLQ
jgi:hypothetical protein